MQLFKGNYSTFKKLKIERDKAIEREAEKQHKEIGKLKAIIDKYATASGKKKKMAQDREKKLGKLLEDKIDASPKVKQINLIIISLVLCSFIVNVIPFIIHSFLRSIFYHS